MHKRSFNNFKNNTNDLVIYAAALQDHYSRALSSNAKKLLKLPPLISAKNNKNNGVMIMQRNIKCDNNQESIKYRKYLSKLTLAQKLGIIPAPPQPLSNDNWALIEQQAQKRKEGEGLCPICLEAFKGEDQTILSCSHMFHKNCLLSFEKLCKIKMCPICRKQDYDKKETNQGFLYYQTKCILLIQKIIRGYLARKLFFELLVPQHKEIRSKLLKRKFMCYKLKKIGKRIDKNLSRQKKASEIILEKIERTVKEKSMAISHNLEELQHLEIKTQEKREKVLEIVWNQYHGNLEIEKKKFEKENSISVQKEWVEIKKKGIERCGVDCAICLNKLFNKKPLYLLSCSHIFHIHCIEALERYSIQNKKKCPICRDAYQKMNLINQN